MTVEDIGWVRISVLLVFEGGPEGERIALQDFQEDDTFRRQTLIDEFLASAAPDAITRWRARGHRSDAYVTLLVTLHPRESRFGISLAQGLAALFHPLGLEIDIDASP